MNGRLLVGAVTLLFCALVAGCVDSGQSPRPLGPADGHDLPPTDLERVAVGTVAPDFTLEAYAGDRVTLSDYRGRDVLLVFYRGHW